ncbi:Tkl protein kinase, partial [Globisporangium splendens]
MRRARSLHHRRQWLPLSACILVLVILVLSRGAATAATCPLSKLEAPATTTFVVDPSDSSKGIVVTATCNETEFLLDPASTANEAVMTVAGMKIAVVKSYPKVQRFNLMAAVVGTLMCRSFSGSVIESLPGTDASSITELDLSSNSLTSLDGLAFPSNLRTLILEVNSITSASAASFPSGLQTLYLSKNGVDSLSTFRFPSQLKTLRFNGNTGLQTLRGTVLPSLLETFLIGGATITNFEIRESDLAVFNTIQPTVTVQVTSCKNGATLTETSSGISVCVLSDSAFDTLYAALQVTPTSAPSSSSSSSTPTASSSSSTNGKAATTTAPSTSTDGGMNGSSSDSNTTQYLVFGLIALAAVIVVCIITWFVQRRRRRRLRTSDIRELLVVAKDLGEPATGTETMSEAPQAPPRSNESAGGYYTNDVRNDEELLPYRLPREDLQLLNEIAVGGFGIVYLANFYDQVVVVKQIAPKKMNSKEILKRFMAEIRLYARLEHPKIARFIGLSWTTLMDLSLVMEYLPNGDLHALLKENRALPNGRAVFTWFSEDSQPRSKILIALDVAEALVYLHSYDPKIIHRDLKSKNVLMSEEWVAKLADFGISREASENTMTGGMGTTAWIAPEVLQGERYSEKADIYSFGVVLSELDTCGHPYNSNRDSDDSLSDPKIALLVSTNAIKPTIEDDCPEAIRDVILSCVEFDPARRPTALEVHYRLRQIRSNALASGFV